MVPSFSFEQGGFTVGGVRTVCTLACSVRLHAGLAPSFPSCLPRIFNRDGPRERFAQFAIGINVRTQYHQLRYSFLYGRQIPKNSAFFGEANLANARRAVPPSDRGVSTSSGALTG
jgi:hypothetical protein